MRTPLRYVIPVVRGRRRSGNPRRAHRSGRSRLDPAPMHKRWRRQSVGTATTECATPGNVQLNATAPDVPAYAYPWDDEFYGPALIMGGGAGAPTDGRWRRPPLSHICFLAHRGGQSCDEESHNLTTLLAATGACATVIAAPVAPPHPNAPTPGRTRHSVRPGATLRSSLHPRRTTTTATGASRSSDSAARAWDGDPRSSGRQTFRLT